MMVLVGAIALLLVAFMLWGIGALVRRKTGPQTENGPVAIAVGLAVIVFVGGLLNWAHIAYGPGLWGVVAVGICVHLRMIGSRVQACGHRRLMKLSTPAFACHLFSARRPREGDRPLDSFHPPACIVDNGRRPTHTLLRRVTVTLAQLKRGHGRERNTSSAKK